MYIVKQTDDGTIRINLQEIIMLTEETIKMVPGIVRLGSRSFRESISKIFHGVSPTGVKVRPLEEDTVYVECHIQVSLGTNFSDISKQVQRVVKYTIEKHYGIVVKSVDVYIEGVI